MRKLIIFAVISLVACSCQDRKKPCRERFEQYYSINIKRCVEAMEGVDSLTATEVCACMMNKLYEIDSTFVYLEPTELEEFVNKNTIHTRACDSLFRKPITPTH